MSGPRPRQARSRRTVARIVDAARQVLAHEGAAGFNTNRIAEVAGVAVGTLYGHFSDKQQIAILVADGIADLEAQRILEVFAQVHDARVPEVVRALVGETFQLYRAHHRIQRAVWAVRTDERRWGERPSEHQLMAVIGDWLDERGLRRDPSDPLVLFHLVEGLCDRLAPLDVDDAQAIAQITRAAMGFLGA